MKSFVLTLFFTVLLSGANAVLAQTPGAAPDKITLPARGITKQEVQSRYGPPNTEVEPVGSPPIGRWVYDKFTIYFEDDRVVHAVNNKIKRQPE
jgi:hypothetical protein